MDDSQAFEESPQAYALRMLRQREEADRRRMDAIHGHDTRPEMPNRRCQTHNALMEPVAKTGASLGYYCVPCGAIQLRPT